MIVKQDEQGTEAWLESRLGKPSASCFSQLITRTGKPSASADKYINKLIGEKLTGKAEQGFKSEAMERGNTLEPEARDEYSFIYEMAVKEVGFILNDDQDYGCSPDGLIDCSDSAGGLEIKCPLTTNMVRYQRDPQKLVNDYFQQIQGCLWVTGRDWWDAFAWHPELAHVWIRVERDNEFIKKLAVEVDKAVTTIKTEVEKRK